MKSNLLIISNIIVFLILYLIRLHHTQTHLGFLLCYLLVILLFCILFLGPVIHLALIFFLKNLRFTFRFFFAGEGVRVGMWKCGCYSTICWRDYLCSIVLPLCLVKAQLYIFMWVCFWGLDSITLIYASGFSPVPYYLYYCSCTGNFEFR